TESQQIIAEFLEQHAGVGEKAGQPVDVGQSQQGTDKAEAVESAEGALNQVLVPRYKRRHGVVSMGVGCLGRLLVPYPGQRHLSSPLVAAERPRCVGPLKARRLPSIPMTRQATRRFCTLMESPTMPDDKRPRLDEILDGGGDDFNRLWDETDAAGE